MFGNSSGISRLCRITSSHFRFCVGLEPLTVIQKLQYGCLHYNEILSQEAKVEDVGNRECFSETDDVLKCVFEVIAGGLVIITDEPVVFQGFSFTGFDDRK